MDESLFYHLLIMVLFRIESESWSYRVKQAARRRFLTRFQSRRKGEGLPYSQGISAHWVAVLFKPTTELVLKFIGTNKPMFYMCLIAVMSVLLVKLGVLNCIGYTDFGDHILGDGGIFTHFNENAVHTSDAISVTITGSWAVTYIFFPHIDENKPSKTLTTIFGMAVCFWSVYLADDLFVAFTGLEQLKLSWVVVNVLAVIGVSCWSLQFLASRFKFFALYGALLLLAIFAICLEIVIVGCFRDQLLGLSWNWYILGFFVCLIWMAFTFVFELDTCTSEWVGVGIKDIMLFWKKEFVSRRSWFKYYRFSTHRIAYEPPTKYSRKPARPSARSYWELQKDLLYWRLWALSPYNRWYGWDSDMIVAILAIISLFFIKPRSS